MVGLIKVLRYGLWVEYIEKGLDELGGFKGGGKAFRYSRKEVFWM